MFVNKKVFIPLLSLACIVSVSHTVDQTLTSYGEWFVSSPKLTDTRAVRSSRIDSGIRSYMQELQAVGMAADKAWGAATDNQDKAKKLEKALHSIDRDFLVQWIDELLTNAEALEKIAKDSYRNVIGFWKIVLAAGDGQEAWKIRLHIWEQQEQEEFPHNHKWDFYSKILTGYLAQDLYTASAAASCDVSSAHSVRQPVSLMPTTNDGQEPCPCRDHYVQDPVAGMTNDTISLQRNETRHIGAGESYYMPYHLIHSIEPGKGAISLVFTSERVVDNSKVFVPMDVVDSDLSRYAPSIIVKELKGKLLLIKKHLQKLQLSNRYLPEMVDTQHQYYDVNNGNGIVHTPQWRKEIENKNDADQHVIQLTNKEMEQYKLSADADGKLLVGGASLDISKEYIFVLLNESMYAAPKDFHHENSSLICHTSFSGYGPVDSVGVLTFNEDGTLNDIEAYSGHYMPTVEHMKLAYEYLQSIGVDVTHAHCVAYRDRVKK